MDTAERSEDNARLTALWESVDSLLARATLPGIVTHKLGPLAAYRLRHLGEPLPELLVMEERAASLCMLTATTVIERVRVTCDGPLLLLKGPELARIYPGHARRFRDIDMLSKDAAAVHRTLLSHGFIKVYDPMYERFGAEHALNVLRWPPFGLNLEVHKGVHWPRYLRRPPLHEIFEQSVPSALGIAGLSAPAPVHHALILAAHAWVHGAYAPLWTLRDLIDIAAASAHVEESELERTAAAWGLERLWRTTAGAIEAIFYAGSETLALRMWGQHLMAIRAQRGYERHFCRLASPYWVAPPRTASVEVLHSLRYIVGPIADESWREKARRLPRAFRNLRAPVGRSGDGPPARDGEQPSR